MVSKQPRLNIVLVEPEIPNNTGNIGRTCVTTGCRLHLVHPLGFDIDEKACRRAGLDYWPRLDLVEHETLGGYLGKHPPSNRTWFLTTKATQSIFDAPISHGDHLVFGRESTGLPRSVHEGYPDQRICVPLIPDERSLNLSTCVAIAVYESVRKMIGAGEAAVDKDGRLIDPDHACTQI
jgi:tRNA (cytidine/uridine-2'-O-)-methyltransferase